jgi:F-type H+-transporting ATPase subunit delta
MEYGLIARRYAKALLEISNENNVVNIIEEDLNYFVNCMEIKDHDFIRLISNPIFSGKEKKRVILYLCKFFKINDLFQKFLFLLIIKRRIHLLPLIKKYFILEVDNSLKRVRVIVSSVNPIKKEDFILLVKYLSRKLKKSILPTVIIDKKLLGGIKIMLRDLRIEYTVSLNLINMEKKLKLSF